ncbi:MAG TPA: MarR family winged helix-turn-helix transcriptional regulator [Fimbriimonadaceae bacterium]|nr:MarR family winged helix-turn-helix transcriptional regulator [Fimbriimonadaceae bacterium]
MANEVSQQAAQLEALLPKLMKLMSPPGENDPLGHLPLGQLRMIRALSAGPRTVCDLGEELGLSPSSVSQMTQRLADAGLLVKGDDPDCRRNRRVCLSDEGRLAAGRRRDLRRARAEHVLRALAPTEREALLELLQRLAEAAREEESPCASAQIEKGYAL